MGEAAGPMIEETVIEILKSSDLETDTELTIRTIAAQRLGLDRFNLDQKLLIRSLIESFLLQTQSPNPAREPQEAARESNHDATGFQESELAARETDKGGDQLGVEARGADRGYETKRGGGNGVQEFELAARVMNRPDGKGVQEFGVDNDGGNGVGELVMEGGVIDNDGCIGVQQSEAVDRDIVLGLEVPQEHHREGGGGDCAQNGNSRIICQLSELRDVTVHDFKGQSMVTIQDYFKKDGMQFSKSKGMSLTADQWLSIKNNIPAIEEAVTRMQSRLRLPAAGKPSDPYVPHPVVDSAQANATEYNTQMDSIYSVQEPILDGSKQKEVEPILPPSGVLPMPIRLDGTNYYLWKHQMEFVLAELKVAYVLTDACPSISNTVLGTHKEMDQAKASSQKWTDDDLICRHKILTYLCDNLYKDYYRKACNAKELWEELKSVYDEDIGTKRSQINKYVQFQIVDGVSILEQVHELQNIAHSICSSGIWIDEYFHVSLIISKLPRSWKKFRLRMMRKEVLPLDMLMQCLKVEEDACNAKQLGKHSHGVGLKCESRVGSQSREIKRVCYNCKKEGHISKNCRDRKTEVSNNGNPKEKGHCPKGDRSYKWVRDRDVHHHM